MATCTFNGTIDADWETPENWTGGTPTSADAAVIDAACTAAGLGLGCASLTVNVSKTLTVPGAGELTTGVGGVTVNGTLAGTGVLINAGPWTFGAAATSTFTGTLLFAGTSAYNLDGQGKNIGNVIIDNDATLTAISAVKAITFVTVSASYYADGGFAHEITGATLTIHATTTTFASTGTWTPSGTCAVVCAAEGRPFGVLNVPTGATTTIGANVYCKKFTGNGTLAAANAAYRLWLMPAAAANWWGFTGTCTCRVGVYLANASMPAPGSAISCVGLEVSLISAGSATWTPGVNINAGAGVLQIESHNAGGVMTLAMGAYNLTCGQVKLGHSSYGADDKAGVLDLGSGNHVITGNIARAIAQDVSSGILFGTSTTTLSGTLDGTGLVCTNTSAIVIGGTINALTVDPALLHVAYAAAGTGNTTVTEYAGVGLGLAPLKGSLILSRTTV